MNKFFNGIPVIVKDSMIIPQYFSDDDQIWLRHLVVAFSRFEGKSKKSWQFFLESGLNFKMPYYKGKFAIQIIEKELLVPQENSDDYKKAKLELYVKASETRVDSSSYSEGNYKRTREVLIEDLLLKYPLVSKLMLEECLISGSTNPSIFKSISNLGLFSELPRRLNSHLIRRIMMRAFIVEFLVTDQTRRLVRQAKFRGLVCEVRKLRNNLVHFRISGPLAIFGPTTIYGKQLQEFIPLLFWNLEFRFRATFRFKEQHYFLHLDSSSPLKMTSSPQLFDSKLEEQFFQDFLKATTQWDLQREPEPIKVVDRLMFPDFLVINRLNATQYILIEIIGFWTEDYIKKKIEEMKLLENLKIIYFINIKLKEKFVEVASTSSTNHTILYFKRKILVEELITILNSISQRSLLP